MLSAFLIVDSLWAMTMVVILPADKELRVFWIYFSFFLSRAEVASSRMRMLGL